MLLARADPPCLDDGVAGEYPRPLEDRDVLVVRGGEHHRVRMRAWLDGYEGPRPMYRVEVTGDLGSYVGTGSDAFAALVELRRQLEVTGSLLAVQGARLDTFPSGMCRDMGGGLEVYVQRPGEKSSPEDLVPTLADAPVDKLATVDDQLAFRKAWWAEAKR